MKGSKCLIVILATTLLLSGCGLLLYPTANKLWRDHTMHRDAEEFLSFVQTSPTTPPLAEPEDTEDDVPTSYPELWLAMKGYNEAIFQGNQSGLASPEDYEKASFILLDYGLDTEVFGVLSIPKLGLEMPLYLGASKENMAKGAAILGQTSLPIGGSNTNCVIAGHRGWNGAAYFLYVPTLEIGDTVTITNLWENLNYRVMETKIIFPDDVDATNLLQVIQHQQTVGAANCAASLVAQLGRMFQEQEQKQSQRQSQRMDRKYRREIQKKKQAMGLRD